MQVVKLSKEIFDAFMLNYYINDDNVESNNETAFISINNSVGPQSHFLSDKKNVKILYFDNVDQDLVIEGRYLYKKITKEQGKELYNFIIENKDKNQIIIHAEDTIKHTIGYFIEALFDSGFEPSLIPGWHSIFDKHYNKRVLKVLKYANDN